MAERRGATPRYNRKGWVLGACASCGRQNYVEPHGTTAYCPRCSRKQGGVWVEHKSIPFRRNE